MNIAVATVCIGEGFARMAAPATATKEAYCAKHGYPLLTCEVPLAVGRHPSWQKLPFLQQVLPHYDWVWMTDADAMVTDDKQRIETILRSTQTKTWSSRWTAPPT